MALEKQRSSKSQAWFCTTGLPSDVVIQVEDTSFHLHKFPLMSKSRKLHHLITEREQNPGAAAAAAADVGEEDEEEIAEEEEVHHIVLPGFPGGVDTFEATAKFCYGVKINLTPWNAIPLRCAAEYLDMVEDYDDQDNLISRIEQFLAQFILRGGLRESVQALKSCEAVLPLAEDLGIVQRCIDSIATRVSSLDPDSSLFGWPVNATGPRPVLWNGIDTGARRRHCSEAAGSSSVDASAAGSWFEDLAILSLPIYKRVIAALKAADPRSEVLEGTLVSYAKRSFPGLSRSIRKQASAPIASEAEQRDLLETVILNLPPGPGESPSRVLTMTPKFLSGLLRTANILRASDASRTALEQRIASQLEQAAVDDLLMPSYSSDLVDSTLYDVDCADRILHHYLTGPDEDGLRLTRVGKLVDGYLAEIASDPNLRPDKFCDLALALPDHARVYDDGLYRAVDVYLKAHPEAREEERERVCGVMDCQKLTLEACTHAAQNERLPLRVVVQVLFFEQLQLRQAIVERRAPPSSVEEGETWRQSGAVRENQVLRLDMDSMRNRVEELEEECSSMRRKIDKMEGGGGVAAAGGWGSMTRRFGCKFKTQVCDSHQRKVVETRRRGRAELSP